MQNSSNSKCVMSMNKKRNKNILIQTDTHKEIKNYMCVNWARTWEKEQKINSFSFAIFNNKLDSKFTSHAAGSWHSPSIHSYICDLSRYNLSKCQPRVYSRCEWAMRDPRLSLSTNASLDWWFICTSNGHGLNWPPTSRHWKPSK